MNVHDRGPIHAGVPSAGAAFVDRVHGGMQTYGIGTPPAGQTYDDYIPRLIIACARKTMAHLESLGEPGAVGTFSTFFKGQLLPVAEAHADAWGIPPAHRLMVGEGKV